MRSTRTKLTFAPTFRVLNCSKLDDNSPISSPDARLPIVCRIVHHSLRRLNTRTFASTYSSTRNGLRTRTGLHVGVLCVYWRYEGTRRRKRRMCYRYEESACLYEKARTTTEDPEELGECLDAENGEADEQTGTREAEAETRDAFMPQTLCGDEDGCRCEWKASSPSRKKDTQSQASRTTVEEFSCEHSADSRSTTSSAKSSRHACSHHCTLHMHYSPLDTYPSGGRRAVILCRQPSSICAENLSGKACPCIGTAPIRRPSQSLTISIAAPHLPATQTPSA